MAIPWMPLTPDARALLAAIDLEHDGDDLLAFPSERERARTRAESARGVVMRVAPISTGTAVLLTLILLLGAGSAAAIGLLAG